MTFTITSAEFYARWVGHPAFWIAVVFLIGLGALMYWIRFRFSRVWGLCAGVCIWGASAVVWHVATAERLSDPCFLIQGGLTLGATAGLILAIPLLLPNRLSGIWLSLGALVCAVLGALLLPYVALLTVCCVGTDCP